MPGSLKESTGESRPGVSQEWTASPALRREGPELAPKVQNSESHKSWSMTVAFAPIAGLGRGTVNGNVRLWGNYRQQRLGNGRSYKRLNRKSTRSLFSEQ